VLLVSALKLVLPDLQHKVGALRASLERLDRAIDTEAAKKAPEALVGGQRQSGVEARHLGS
jgi:hypothetical protein